MKQVGTSWLIGFLGVAALIGCGGSQQSGFGGSSAGSWNGGSGSRMNQNPKNNNNPGQQPGVNQEISAGGGFPLFITDASDPQVEHAYVRIYEASLYTSKNSIPVFVSPEGEVVDLKSLKDSQGMRFLFLGATPMTPPDLVRIQFIIGKEFVVVPKGGAASEVRQFADQLNEGKNKTRLTLSLPKKDMQALVVNFDLGAATDDKQKKTLIAIKEVDAPTLTDPSRQDLTAFTGKVASLNGSAPELTFGFNFGNGRSLRVNTTSETAIYDSKGDAAPKVANGTQVEVRGAFDLTTKMFAASALRVIGKGSGDEEVSGFLQKDALDKGELVLVARTANGPSKSIHNLPLDVTKDTVFMTANGDKTSKEDFIKAVGTSPVEVDGSFDKKGETLKVNRIKVDKPAPTSAPKPNAPAATPAEGAKPAEGTPDAGGEEERPEMASEILGAVATVDKSAGTFTVKPSKLVGFKSDAESLPIQIYDKTAFRDAAGKKMTKEQLLDALAAGKNVRVRGGLVPDGFRALMVMLTK
ncbi:MAG: hypothetical protein K1X67_10590 [Fimbriimonadaceae bacterium]|nr:hypothetical protein [Fimbriimonadaceae bacterium]